MAWLTVREAARYLRKPDEYLYAHIYAGDLPAYRPRDQERPRIIVSTDDLDGFVRTTFEKVDRSAL